MGKIHRIKKHFWRLMTHEPHPPVGYYHLAHTSACIYVGRNQITGQRHVFRYSSDRAYQKLVDQLLSEYRAGIARSD